MRDGLAASESRETATIFGGGENLMSEIRDFVDRVLAKAACETRYRRRKEQFPRLAEYGLLPPNVGEISNDKTPWYCHGLALRMAIYPDGADCLFERLEHLLGLPRRSDGWSKEFEQNWNTPNNHWAKKWDRFFHLMWMLQCFEYFGGKKYRVTFPISPDFRVETNDGKTEFVECYFYKKWWSNEEFLTELLRGIDPQLEIRRIRNVARPTQHPFSEGCFASTLESVAKLLTPQFLEEAGAKAARNSPHVVHHFENSDAQIILGDDGEYVPDMGNAQGDPSCSAPLFLREVLKSKCGTNNLRCSRPNVLMVNGLGVDYQFIIRPETEWSDSFLCCEIDEVWLAACGIGEMLANCTSMRKIPRQGYSGSEL